MASVKAMRDLTRNAASTAEAGSAAARAIMGPRPLNSGVGPVLGFLTRADEARRSEVVHGLQATVGNREVTRMLQRAGMGDVRLAEHEVEAAAQQKLQSLAMGLLDVQLKADALASVMTEGNLAAQHAMLTQHIHRMVVLLTKASEAGPVDSSVSLAVEVGTTVAGLAADLMHLLRVARAGGVAAVAIKGANLGLAWTWEAMRELEADPRWPERDPRAAHRCIMNAEHHRDKIAGDLPGTAVMTAGVNAAQLMDLAISGPKLLASGNRLLAGLAEWLTRGGGGSGGIRVVAGGGLAMVTAAGTRVLTAAEVEALRAAGLLSAKAYAVYSVAQGGGGTGGGPPGGGGGPGDAPRPLRTDDPSLRAANLTDPKKVAALREAIRARGFKIGDNPVVILETNLAGNQKIKLIVDGNHRLVAARAEMLQQVKAVWISEKEFFFMCERAGLNPLEIIQRATRL